MTEAVTLDIDGHVAQITLNRPESLNALSQTMMRALDDAIEQIRVRGDLRAVIVTGTGRAFCAGGDLIEFEAALKQGGSALVDIMRYNQDVLYRLENLDVPVIGAINGTAVAGGLELLLCCDILIGCAGVRMGDGHTQYAVVPTGGATVRLAERIPTSHANMLFYTAGLVPIEKFAQWGLVSDLVAPEELMDRARAVAAEICTRSPQANRKVKMLLRQGRGTADRDARLRAELDAFARHMEGEDLAAGLTAFREKTRPQYRS